MASFSDGPPHSHLLPPLPPPLYLQGGGGGGGGLGLKLPTNIPGPPPSYTVLCNHMYGPWYIPYANTVTHDSYANIDVSSSLLFN